MAYNNNGGNFGGGERKMYQGNWKCSVCGKEITQLPFEPDPNRLNQLKCRDCHQKTRDSYGGGGGGRRF